MSKVPVGLGTQVGYGGGVLLFVAAVVAYFNGDHSNANVAVIMSGLAVIATTAGRMLQAAVQAKQKQPAASGWALTGGSANTAPAASVSGLAITDSLAGSEVRGVQTAPNPDSLDAVVAEEADLPSDAEETQNVPAVESSTVPVPPAGEPPSGQGRTPPLEPSDTTP